MNFILFGLLLLPTLSFSQVVRQAGSSAAQTSASTVTATTCLRAPADGTTFSAGCNSSTNTGVGTASPAYKLDVSGAVRVTGQGIFGGTVTVKGVTDGSVAGPGEPGEVITCSVADQAFPASGQYGDICSISLTAGDWDCSLFATAQQNGATCTGLYSTGIGTATGNDAAGLGVNANNVYFQPPAGASVSTSGSIAGVRKNITGTTTFYAKISGAFTVATPTISGLMYCRRMR